MKKVLIFFCFVAFTLSLVGQSQISVVEFEQETVHLGKVSMGDKVNGEFVFTNISKESVEIDLVSTCECTDARWTRGEIKPGQKGVISFIFDTQKKKEVEPVDVDVYLTNVDPNTGNPLSYYLRYTFEY